MEDNKYSNIQQDFYSINSDFTGSREVKNSQELVEFHNASTVRIWLNEQNSGYPAHWHSAMEIIMPVENNYILTTNNDTYTVEPGDILIVPPGEMHEIAAPEFGKRFIFMFDLSLIAKLNSFSGIESILSQPLFITEETHPQIYDEIYQLLLRMRNEYFSKTEYAELMIYSLLLNFFVKIGYNHLNTGNLFPNVRLYKQKEYVQKFNTLMDYIDEHYMEDLNLETIAKSIGFSKFHFSRLFKQYTNFTFCDYLCYRRIKVAEELLAEPDLSITEIALQAGFPSISTFNRLFKQRKNCTPSEYRSKNNFTATKKPN